MLEGRILKISWSRCDCRASPQSCFIGGCRLAVLTRVCNWGGRFSVPIERERETKRLTVYLRGPPSEGGEAADWLIRGGVGDRRAEALLWPSSANVRERVQLLLDVRACGAPGRVGDWEVARGSDSMTIWPPAWSLTLRPLLSLLCWRWSAPMGQMGWTARS